MNLGEKKIIYNYFDQRVFLIVILYTDYFLYLYNKNKRNFNDYFL